MVLIYKVYISYVYLEVFALSEKVCGGNEHRLYLFIYLVDIYNNLIEYIYHCSYLANMFLYNII